MLSGEIKAGEAALTDLSEQSADLLLVIPNAPHPETPDGAGEEDNYSDRLRTQGSWQDVGEAMPEGARLLVRSRVLLRRPRGHLKKVLDDRAHS